MKRIFVKAVLVGLAVVLVATDADAQRRGRKRTTTPDAGNQQQENNSSKIPSGYNPYSNIPIEVDSSGVTSDMDAKPSLRNDNAFDKSTIVERNPLAYEHLRWDDAMYTERVWRELDLREKMNMPFRYKAQDNNGDQRFASILIKAIKSGELTAFDDERFTTPLSVEEISSRLSGGVSDTTPVYNIDDPSKIDKYTVTRSSFNVDDISKIRLKEDWVFDKEASRMFVRILGVSLLKTEYIPGTKRERGVSSLFWIYYPDARALLSKYEVYNPKNMGMGRMTWEELFETRMFSSYVTKSTLDNPLNQTIKQYIKDDILVLLEGDNIKNKIFDFEQNLWEY